MAEYVQQGQASTFRWVPPERATAATAGFYSPSGTLLGTLSPALENVVLPVAAASNSFTGTTSSGTGTLVPGRRYWLSSPTEGECLVRLLSVNGTAFVLSDAPAVTLAAGCTLRGAEFSVTLGASLTGERGTYYRVEWLATGVAGELRGYQTMVHICRQLFAPAMDSQRAAAYVGSAFPHAAKGRGNAWYVMIADRAAQAVERRLLSSGRLPQLMGDHELLGDCGIIALRLQLALEGLVPAGFDPAQYQDQQERELTRQLDYATANQWVDENDTGDVTAAEFAPITSIVARLA